MSRKDERVRHSQAWNSAVEKILQALGKNDFAIAGKIFADQHESFYGRKIGRRDANFMFLAWLMTCFMKENTPLVPWFIIKHGKELSAEETAVLLAAHESWFGAFKVKSFKKDDLTLVDTAGKTFVVETVDLPPIEKGTTVMTRIISKGVGRWFVPGRIALLANTKLYSQLASHRRFISSWNSYLVGFFKYMQKQEGLSEATADLHAENANVLMMFLEGNPRVDSFSKVDSRLLKEDFKKFSQKYVFPHPNLHKLYYSLYWFFTYLREKRGEENTGALKWLHAQM